MTDYRQMWTDLDMDLETHDQLCAVLPMAFGDTYLSQENRPENMAFYDFVVSEIHGVRPAELIELQKQGGKVFGTFCVFVPDEVIIACGGAVTGLCGGSQFWVPEGEKVLPSDMCPLIKASLGAHFGKTCPYFSVADLYVGETTCDGKKKAYEILGADKRTYVMDVPQMKRQKDIDAWTAEIAEFAAEVQAVTGRKLTAASLADAIALVNEKRRALGRVFEARKAKDCIPISGKDALLMMQIAFFDDPARCAEMANKLADELEARIEDGVSVFAENTKRILVTGTPLAIPNWKLHHIIETSGAAVVCEEMCTGTRYFENLVDESAETIEGQFQALSERYMKNNCACFTPNPGRIEDVVRMAREYHVDGVIDANLKFCTLYDVEKPGLAAALEAEGIPVLALETDYTDNDAEQLRTRVGAFVEMLEA
ncbi:double-cubane-cluster-containing anaerobic reductase [Raoultibacter phocaeensis]|uniref:double-cubane-cluster-containing anaerobic reductase n=1 Tax=Raoultibacter phocaeensis TaxID=2479841 RepID=UPI001119CE35|nr:double-cubane-cluster-containing anaerobic reductase [Raoultibacter phocaeensis]